MAFPRQVRVSAALLLAIGGRLAGQSLTVPSSSDVYRRLESVSALFPARGLHLGQRPMSQREMSRIVRRLVATVEAAPPSGRRDRALGALRVIRAALGQDTLNAGAGVLAAGRAELYGSDARSERIRNNGLGLIDAVTNPFAQRRQGWPTAAGGSVTLSPTVAWSSARFAMLLEPRYTVSVNAGSGAGALALHRTYARGTFSNVALQLGADELLWGQSPNGALYVSGNAAPLPAITLATDTAFSLPWLFRLAGPVRATLFLSDLGPTQDPPHARLAAWLVSIQPWTRFELGVSVLDQTGGNGAPPATFLDRVIDLFPAIDAIAPQHSDFLFSNKVAGGNLRLRFPELSGLDLYWELAIDDFDARRLRSSVVDDMGHLLGARIQGGPIVWRAEWHRTSLRLYEHTQFRSGVSYREHLIGDPLGPHAKAGYLAAEWQATPTTFLEARLGDERRDPSQYTVTVSDTVRDRGFRFIRLSNDPIVRRALAIGSLERSAARGAIRLSVGYDRAWRTGQPARNEFMGQLTLSTRLLPTF